MSMALGEEVKRRFVGKFEATNMRLSSAIGDASLQAQLSPKQAKRVTIDGANTSLNFKEIEQDLENSLP